ncbi:conserved hypothetical protein [Talaromyces stipitatus ATCC 10500]|uniref:Uncharacterized protein n=1 Tax=Talaromyces stipitatus (strain ATCC 10500 / CBS 375.48 / QM 6759 / NRRL 1006) TaxID=441959 RepID=B8M861_TALSN|nr:uncharacterized protein TSTA_032760 [Talaromyces stipitatus ATCC 10500]EED20023.1 conserved hypothetical protein [Talaromyces stipitatus ATCC 10500]
MAQNSEQATTPLLSEEHSDSDLASLSGSTVYSDPPVHEGKIDAKADTESLPEYTEYEPTHLEKGGLLAEEEVGHNNNEEEDRCKRRGCIRRRCRRASGPCADRKRRVRRHILMFIKAIMLFGCFSFLVTRMCLRHRRAEKLPVFSNHPSEEFGTGREIILDQGSQAIFGRYPLYDLLHLKTTSGSVNIVVDPQPADPKKPGEPARLVIETTSGSVSVAFLQHSIDTMATFENGDIKKVDGIIDLDYLKNSGATGISQVTGQIPYRPYEVEVKTQSGSINGRFIFTTSALLESDAGHIAASFVPVVSPDEFVHATLTTDTDSGAQQISLSEPLIIDASGKTYPGDTGLSKTSAWHTSNSGHIQVSYPHSWAGNVEAVSSSGWTALKGDNLQVIEHSRGHAVGIKQPNNDDDDRQPKWWGSRGDMEVALESSGSGSIEFCLKDRSYPVYEEESEGVEVYILGDN